MKRNCVANVSFKDKSCLLITTLFGIGHIPFFPGTASCLAAVIVFIFIKRTAFFFAFTLISLILAFALSGHAEELYKKKDCKKIVIDDFSGMLVSLLFIPRTLPFIITGFFIFRILDLLKVPPADSLERLSGARGVVGDDLTAGIYTNIILQLVRLALKISS